MTRGRRKDTSLPPSRALFIQRAYRDRKAKYLSDLEERCRKAEEDNERLRKELELARSESAVGSINIELVSRGDYFWEIGSVADLDLGSPTPRQMKMHVIGS